MHKLSVRKRWHSIRRRWCVCKVQCAWAFTLTRTHACSSRSMDTEHVFSPSLLFSLLFYAEQSVRVEIQLNWKRYWIFSSENSIRSKQVLVIFILFPLDRCTIYFHQVWSKQLFSWFGWNRLMKNKLANEQNEHTSVRLDSKVRFDWHQCI